MRRLWMIALVLILIMSPAACFADDEEEKEGVDYPEYAVSEDGFQAFQDTVSALSGFNLTQDDIYSLLPGTNSIWNETVNAFSGMKSSFPSDFGTAWNSLSGADIVSIENLNLQYANLKTELTMMGWGEKYGITLEPMELGYSGGVLEQFSDTFGDFKGSLNTEIPTIPESFSMSSILGAAKTQRDSAVGDFYQTNAYKSVLNDTSFKTLLAEASKEKTMPALYSASQMDQGLSTVDAVAESQRDAKHASNQGIVNSFLQSSQEWVNDSSWQNNTLMRSKYDDQVARVTAELAAKNAEATVDNTNNFDEHVKAHFGLLNDGKTEQLYIKNSEVSSSLFPDMPVEANQSHFDIECEMRTVELDPEVKAKRETEMAEYYLKIGR